MTGPDEIPAIILYQARILSEPRQEHHFFRAVSENRQLRQRKGRTLRVMDEGFGFAMAAFESAEFGDGLLEGVVAVRRLARVGETGLAFAIGGGGNIHVIARSETGRVFAV